MALDCRLSYLKRSFIVNKHFLTACVMLPDAHRNYCIHPHRPHHAGGLCASQATNSLIFIVITVPTEDLTVYVVIQAL